MTCNTIFVILFCVNTVFNKNVVEMDITLGPGM